MLTSLPVDASLDNSQSLILENSLTKSQKGIPKILKLKKNSQQLLDKFLEMMSSLELTDADFYKEHFSKELYHSGFQGFLEFLKIWEEMDGNIFTFLDFEKVFLAFMDQVTRSTESLVITRKQLENAEKSLDLSNQSPSTRKDSLYYSSFLKNQRLSCMKKGAYFRNSQGFFRVFRLSEDEQYLYFQDYSFKQELPSIDALHSVVKVEDISLISLETSDMEGNSYSFSISGFDHEFIKDEFQLNFRTNSSTQFVEWYEGLCFLTGKEKESLPDELPFNGPKVVSILEDLKSRADAKPILKRDSISHGIDPPNFDFFYKDLIVRSPDAAGPQCNLKR